MSINVWSILLIAFASQCLFLIVALLVRPANNRKAMLLLVALLAIIFCVNVSNLTESTYLYRKMPSVAGFARGMVFLLGPLLYFYTLSILKPAFRFKAGFLLHLLPYLLTLIFIRIQLKDVPVQLRIAAIDGLMEGTIKMTPLATMWFVSYFIHLSAYMFFIRREMLSSVNNQSGNYLIPLEQRLSWLKKVTIAFSLIAVVFLGIISYVAITGLYTINGNFIYSMALAVMIYLIAFQAIKNGHLLLPDFATKYKSIKINQELEEEVFIKLQRLFEDEKIFTDSELKIGTVAQMLDLQPHIISQIINERFNKTFNELLNHYRVEEFKARLTSAKFSHYSIIGIAYDVGYKNKSTFNEAFKKQTGITPSAFLKSVQLVAVNNI